MFGDVGYLMNSNMCFGIHKEYLIIRTSIENADDLPVMNVHDGRRIT